MAGPEPAFDDADLNGLVDGRIEPARAAALADSLGSDPEARSRIDGWKRQNDTLRTMFSSVLFEPIPVRLLPGAVPPRPAAPVPARLPPTRPRGRVAGAAATASVGMVLVGFALGALVSVGTDGFGLSRTAGRRAPAVSAQPEVGLAERAAEAHRTFAADALRPVELTAAEEPRLLRWIQHRLGPSLRIPDLHRLGWSLVGGRVLPGPAGATAFLLYGSGAERLGLTVSPARPSGPDGTRTVGGGTPVAVTSWGDEAFGYALTASRGGDWMEHNAVALRESVAAQVRGDVAPP